MKFSPRTNICGVLLLWILISITHDTSHIVLIQAFVNCSQINVVAVLGAPVPLRNLIIQRRCQVARHEVIHSEMID